MIDLKQANNAMWLIPPSIRKIASGKPRNKVVISIEDIRDITTWLEINGMENTLSMPSEERIQLAIERVNL